MSCFSSILESFSVRPWTSQPPLDHMHSPHIFWRATHALPITHYIELQRNETVEDPRESTFDLKNGRSCKVWSWYCTSPSRISLHMSSQGSHIHMLHTVRLQSRKTNKKDSQFTLGPRFTKVGHLKSFSPLPFGSPYLNLSCALTPKDSTLLPLHLILHAEFDRY